MRLNQAAFGTNEARHWFHSLLQTASTSTVNSKVALRLTFDNFYNRILQYRDGLTDAAATKPLNKEELRKVSLRTRLVTQHARCIFPAWENVCRQNTIDPSFQHVGKIVVKWNGCHGNTCVVMATQLLP